MLHVFFFWWFLFLFLEQTRLLPKLLFVFSVLLVVLHFLPRKKGGKQQQIPNTSGFCFVSRCLFFVSLSRKRNIGAIQHHQDLFSGTSNEGILTWNSWWHLQGWSCHDKNMFLDGPDFWGPHQYIYLIYIYIYIYIIDIFQQLKGFDSNHIKWVCLYFFMTLQDAIFIASHCFNSMFYISFTNTMR